VSTWSFSVGNCVLIGSVIPYFLVLSKMNRLKQPSTCLVGVSYVVDLVVVEDVATDDDDDMDKFIALLNNGTRV
jgi:hypothetical protein